MQNELTRSELFSLILWGSAILAGIFIFFTEMGDAWDFEDCWRLDRQARQGHPVNVPERCEPHGFEPRTHTQTQ